MKRLQGVRIARVATVPYFVLSQLGGQLASLPGEGAEVVVVTSSGPELAALEARGIKCITLEIPRALSPWKDLVALLKLCGIFLRGNFEIFHSTTPKAGLLAALAGFLARVPIRLHTFTGQPWATMKGPLSWAARGSDWLIGRLNTRCYADSESQRQFLVEQGIVDSARLAVLGAGSLAGVDLDRFNPLRFSEAARAQLRADIGIPLDAGVVLFVGRITVDKGVRELLAAFRTLKEAGSTAHLVCVGPFDAERGGREGISRDEIGVIADTHVVGYTETPEAFMSMADILCLPSYREGFGTVVIEAAAMGVPTVGTNIYGLSDAVLHGKTGVLAPVRNAVALAGALAELLEKKELCARMGRAARARVEALFTSQMVTGYLIEEYHRLLSGSREAQKKFTYCGKRLLDIIFGMIMLVLAGVPMVLIAMVVKLTSPGPVLYWSDRIGRGNRVFRMPKFRTMRLHTPAVATHLLKNPEQYLTPVGGILRKSSLDELPQLWSILKGDMSLVGPRPALYNQDDLIQLRTEKGLQHLAPGVTGWAQVNGRDELPISHKVQLDAEYLRNISLTLDLKILLRTFLKVLRREGIAH